MKKKEELKGEKKDKYIKDSLEYDEYFSLDTKCIYFLTIFFWVFLTLTNGLLYDEYFSIYFSLSMLALLLLLDYFYLKPFFKKIDCKNDEFKEKRKNANIYVILSKTDENSNIYRLIIRSELDVFLSREIYDLSFAESEFDRFLKS